MLQLDMADFSGARPDWQHDMFGGTEASTGSRLGVSYLRAQEDNLEVKTGRDDIEEERVRLHQYVTDEMAISGVIWDAGLLMVDFISWEERIRKNKNKEEKSNSKSKSKSKRRRNLLDLGCGTGVVGILASVICGEDANVVFSDVGEIEHIIGKNMRNFEIVTTSSTIDISTAIAEAATAAEGEVEASAARSDSDSKSPNTHNASTSNNRDTMNASNTSFIAYDWTSTIPPPDDLARPRPRPRPRPLSSLSQDNQGTVVTATSDDDGLDGDEGGEGGEGGGPNSGPEEGDEGDEGTKESEWDTVYCSDVLYDKKTHEPLLRLLRNIVFKRLVFGYVPMSLCLYIFMSLCLYVCVCVYLCLYGTHTPILPPMNGFC